jgi:transcriptional regulator with GAF, ATPase, and Fis domain
MEQFRSVLLKLWREACRHIQINEFTSIIAPSLVENLPLQQILVRRVDAQLMAVETLAMGFAAPQNGLPFRTEGSPQAIDRLADWIRTGSPRYWSRSERDDPMLQLLAPGGTPGDAWAGPIRSTEGHDGVLVLLAPAGVEWDSHHRMLVEVLLEPFSVALANDDRIREIAALREAAEADRISLLSRLGRKALGDTIVGAETGLRAVMERVELVARSSAPVLIFGETGSGKELVARAIHTRSPRAPNAFLRVNCGAIAPELIDSELFGHERGAFTGAISQRKGWFERADGGTLFLDEIGDLPPGAQVRMLRILQDGWFERVGGQAPVHVDVRMVAATNRDLPAMVAEGRFRQDLWYRLAVFPILVPPLHERQDDIADLARHFAERAAIRFGLRPTLPSADDVRLLRAYRWPGNVRELAAVIDRAAILGDGKSLEIAKALGASEVSAIPVRSSRLSVSGSTQNEILSLDDIIKKHIIAALEITQGRIEGPHGCARILGLNANTLRAKMRKLGIRWSDFRAPGAPG